MDVRKRLLVPYSAERMFDLIEAAERYPEFMPWCASAAIVERTDAVVVADIVVAHRGVRFDFRTRNPKLRPHAMSIRLERGPFRRFEGEWRLAALGSEGCRIEFEMRYDFNSVMARLAGPVFDRITQAMVDAYVARADALYGALAEGGTNDVTARTDGPSLRARDEGCEVADARAATPATPSEAVAADAYAAPPTTTDTAPRLPDPDLPRSDPP
jgi:ribosome-associated toxin RatA of RatAB toxin-antitoxin module